MIQTTRMADDESPRARIGGDGVGDALADGELRRTRHAARACAAAQGPQFSEQPRFGVAQLGLQGVGFIHRSAGPHPDSDLSKNCE
jgi:hypothetical protein